jgi:hypothetical protein
VVLEIDDFEPATVVIDGQCHPAAAEMLRSQLAELWRNSSNEPKYLLISPPEGLAAAWRGWCEHASRIDRD